jgi:putative hydrolase of the HAD superfamily
MQSELPITTLFLDIGGVLLTNGWDHIARHKAAETFSLDFDEMGERHHLTFDTYEEGKLPLDEYLERVIFYKPRSFSREEFRAFMFAQSQPYTEMISLIAELKAHYDLKVAAVSNEGRELTLHRIQAFDLTSIVDFFISSCFVHFRKPDHDIYRIALDIAQVKPEQVLYIDDRAMFVQIAQSLGIRGIHHMGIQSTIREMEKLGLARPIK